MKKLFEIYKETMFSPTQVLEKAIDRTVPHTNTGSYTKKNFSQIIDQIGEEAYRIFLEEQEKSGRKAVKEYFRDIVPEGISRDKVLECVASSFKEFDRFFLSLAQSRKPRAGGTFELIIKKLFKKMNYPFAEQQVINGKPDFLMPGREHYDKHAMDCIIFTAKRTIRERWRQIVTEGTRGLGFFLATIDEKVTENQLGEMRRNRIYLVVSSDLKKKVLRYNKAVNVISFEEFFRDYLDPAMKRWKKARIIK